MPEEHHLPDQFLSTGQPAKVYSPKNGIWLRSVYMMLCIEFEMHLEPRTGAKKTFLFPRRTPHHRVQAGTYIREILGVKYDKAKIRLFG